MTWPTPSLEVERLAAVPRAVELLAAGPRDADVVRADGAAGGRLLAVADDLVVEHELGGRVLLRDGDDGLLAVGHVLASQ
ncbi:hypothetical protein GCM10025868_46090 [Angustibacter aerolatus]|nr:hypothetical protein GCM10025868_46090 [Angustibacter aerolatus]